LGITTTWNYWFKSSWNPALHH